MINTTKVTIGESDFYIRRMEPFKSLQVLGDLQKKLLLPLVEVLKVREALSEDGAKAALVEAVKSLSSNLDGATLVTIAKQLLDSEYISVVLSGGDDPRRLGPGEVNIHLGSLADLTELCVEVVKVNYADFGQRAVSLIGAAQAQAAKAQGQ